MQTARRFALYGLDGTMVQTDANNLPFHDHWFDYAYSWGVLHHSPDLALSIAEMMRVIRPGGGFGLMLYHRQSIAHWYLTEYVEGFLHNERRFLGPLELTSRYTDGASHEGNPHTWPVTRSEMQQMLAPFSKDVRIRSLGTELDHLLPLWLPLPRSHLFFPRAMKKVWARRFGWSLWIYGHKDYAY